MKPIEIFNELNGGGWTTGLLDTQWKVVDGILMFQGSSSLTDWILNFLAAPMKAVEPYKDMTDSWKVHAGFFIAYKANAEVIQALTWDRVAGYSRGGPLALFAIEDRQYRLGYKLEKKSAVFGCPRGVIGATSCILNRWSNVVRFDNPHDIVTHVPPSIMGYQHVGERIVLGGEAEKPKDTALLTWLSGHSQEEYQQRLASMVEEI